MVFFSSVKRFIYNDLLRWKDSPARKPLILRGARQVGKSYILSEFGKNEFPAFHRFDFEKNGTDLIPLFEGSLDPGKILQYLALFQNRPIAQEDLIILDEIQNCPRALTSLKYFCEERPEQPICAAGSLLGVALSNESYPVGKVRYLDLFPMNFEEFLMNSGQDLLADAFDCAWKEKREPSLVHSRLWDLLKEYYVVGGMPEVVSTFFESLDQKAEGLLAARNKQMELLRSFLEDFIKHSGAINAAHLSAVFENIPQQLSGYVDTSVKRYRFKNVLSGGKGYALLESPIHWLEKAGLVYRVEVCSRAELPFKTFCKPNLFKLFIFDIGLLGCMLDLSPKVLMMQDYGLTKGFFAENFVAGEFKASGETSLYSWTERNSEIEFLIEREGEIIPIEVKSGLRTQAKSLRQYILKYNPHRAIKISGHPLSVGSGIVDNIPLYYSGKTCEEIRKN